MQTIDQAGASVVRQCPTVSISESCDANGLSLASGDSLVAKAAGLSRIKSVYTFSLSSTESETSTDTCSGTSSDEPQHEQMQRAPLSNAQFGWELHEFLQREKSLHCNAPLRKLMEPYLRHARLEREGSQFRANPLLHVPMTSWMGVPYPALRSERPFLFDEFMYPLHTTLAEAFGVDDLSQLHARGEKDAILARLVHRERRAKFHATYENFVTCFCIPLLHSLAISKRVLQHVTSDRVRYRYQAFPSLTVATPHSEAQSPTCDAALGHSVACLSFYVPLTPISDLNAVYTESYPGREDWHSLTAKSFGLGYVYDGARCLRFTPINATNATHVSMQFRVMLYSDDDALGSKHLLDDKMTQAGPGYYDEAAIDLKRASIIPGMDIVLKRNSKSLLDPDFRHGEPFSSNALVK